MKQPDSNNKESLKIDFEGLKKRLSAKEVTAEDFADVLILSANRG